MADLQPQDHVLVNAAPLEEMIVLQHITDAVRAFFWVFPVYFKQTVFRRKQPADQREEGGFSASGWSDDGDEFSFFHRKRNIGQGRRFPFCAVVSVGDIFKFQQGLHGKTPLL